MLLTLVLASAILGAAEPHVAGVPHFFRVNDHIYRGAQPTGEGWKSLAKLGVKTVIDLRQDGEDHRHWTREEQRAVEAAGMRYVSVPLPGLAGPQDVQIARIMPLLNSGEPVFVHCKRGKDRTGTVIAAYRILYERWDNRRAVKEAESYGMSLVEIGMKRYLGGLRAGSERAATIVAAPATAPATP